MNVRYVPIADVAPTGATLRLLLAGFTFERWRRRMEALLCQPQLRLLGRAQRLAASGARYGR